MQDREIDGMDSFDEVFECPVCRHICVQTGTDVTEPGAEKRDIMWQCGDCFVIYTDRFRKLEERRRMKDERHVPASEPPDCHEQRLD